jgi:alpha,alpha-trehalose phosphorylase
MWHLKRQSYSPDTQMIEESLFMVGNGYLGIRGAFEEGYAFGDSVRGTYINGLYDRVPMVHAEHAVGFPTIQDKQPRIVDTQICEIYLDGERVLLESGRYADYERTMDYALGQSKRHYRYTTSALKDAWISFTRMASFVSPNLATYVIEIDYDGKIELVSVIDTDIENYVNPNDPRLAQGHAKLMTLTSLGAQGSLAFASMSTKKTGISQAVAVHHEVYSPKSFEMKHTVRVSRVETHVQAKEKIRLVKLCAFTDEIREVDPLEKAKALALQGNYEHLLKEQEEFLARFWKQEGITIVGSEKDQQAIRFMQYQLLQSVGMDSYSNVAAKGLSGEGYEGHYFWDTEIYILPVIMMQYPERAKALLAYRHRILEQAKKRALELGHRKGAAYAWRTISGIECSGYFPAGTAQYHINADIAYAFIQHHLLTGDCEFMVEKGFEVIAETARIWLEIGHFYEGHYRIHAVTGPDEYTAIVNNNYYTNALAKYHLYWSAKLYTELLNHKEAKIQELAKALVESIGLDESEVALMFEASQKMYLPYDEKMGIYLQDDAFLSKPKWPFWDQIEAKPLLLHYHPLTIYRYQVLKQADAVLAHFLVEDYADLESIQKGLDYYEGITTHDSSLSSCVYGMMSARVGDLKKAYDFFEESVELDLENTHGNTKDGLHMANISGTILSVTHGFGGLRVKEQGLQLRPQKPENWSQYSFSVHYLGAQLRIVISEDIALLWEGKDQITLWLYDEQVTLEPNIGTNFKLRGLKDAI